MILSEPLIAEAMTPRPLARAAIYVAIVVGVLGIAALKNRKAQKEAIQ